MSYRKTTDDYIAIAFKSGIEWLDTDIPATVLTLTRWRCSSGHEWEATYSAIQQGKGCHKCGGTTRKVESDYYDLASQKGIEWVGRKAPQNALTKTIWRCVVEHEWEGTYKSIRKSAGSGCPYCAGNKQKTPYDYALLAEKRDFIWMGPPTANATTKTTWQCLKGHVWQARYSDIASGYGCPYCAQKAPKTLQDYLVVGQDRGIEWVGEVLPNGNHTPTKWRCSNKHEWSSPYSTIQSGNGCPYCAGLARKTKEDYHFIASQNGFGWTGTELPPNTGTNTRWICSKGHEFEARYNSIFNGRGCPYCANRINGIFYSSQQARVCDYVDGEMNIKVGDYFVDIVVKIAEQWVAIEYDGWYWHKDKLEQDEQRNKDLIEAGWRILRIKSNELIPDKSEIDAAIIQLLNGSRYEEIILEDWGKD